MKNLTNENLIFLDVEILDKIDLFKIITKKLEELGRIKNPSSVIESFYEKENITSTFLGNGCALPHAKSSDILETTVVFLRLSKKIVWNIDENDAKYIFAVLSKEDEYDKHIDIIMNLSRKILNEDDLKVFGKSMDKKEIEKIINSN